MRNKAFFALLTCAFVALAASVANAQSWQELQTSTDEAALIQAITNIGDAPEDIHNGNVACKRLAVYGTDAAIPALVALLPNEKQNFNARFALEAMPSEAVDAALLKAAKELKGACLVGVIDTIGVRGKADSFATLKEIADANDDPAVQKAIYAACGMIASPEAEAFLVEESTKDLGAMEYYARKALGDAILDVADNYEKSGQLDKAAALDDVVAAAAFPKYEKEAGIYRSLINKGADSAAKVVELLQGDDGPVSDVALKSIREFDAAASAKVVAALVENFDKFDAVRKVRVVRAFENLKADDAKAVAFPKLTSLANADEVALRAAVAKALVSYAGSLENAAFTRVDGKECNDALRNAKIALGVALAKAKPALFENMQASALLDDMDETDALIQLKIVELARIKTAGPALVKIANERQGALRDAALSALSEIVELDDLQLLVDALNGETDDAKVDWILRAACTRLPREECAAKVADLFAKSDLEQQLKILPLLKQIGGKTALDAVAAACNKADTIDKATQILGEWNTPEDAQAVAAICLAIAQQSNDAKYHSRGIRGYVRVARQFELPLATKIEMCKTAFNTARRPEDKALIFEVFKRLNVAENVAAALEYAQYPEYKDAACEAAVVVAEKIRTSQPGWNWNEKSGDEAKDASAKILVDGMKKVVETTDNADLKARAQKLL
jgi:hypothetical protein